MWAGGPAEVANVAIAETNAWAGFRFGAPMEEMTTSVPPCPSLLAANVADR
jgi:hypothetical protein